MAKPFLSRRAFLTATAAAAAGSALAANSVQIDAEPDYAAAGYSGAGDRIRFGIVGVGMEGSGVLATACALPGTECVAATDLYDGRHTLAREIGGKPIKTTRRYQELLDDKSIDAILIAVPDHWGVPRAETRAGAQSRHLADLRHYPHRQPRDCGAERNDGDRQPGDTGANGRGARQP